MLASAGILSLTACGERSLEGSSVSDRAAPNTSLTPAAPSSSVVFSQSIKKPNANAESLAEISSTSGSESTSEDLEIVPTPPNEDGEICGAELVLNSGRCIMLHSMDSENGKSYAAAVNRYKEKFPDVNMYSLIVPTAISYYLPEKFKEYDPGEKAHIDEINAQLKNITPVDVYSALAKHTNEPIYFNTDHHWTQLGAFYGAEEFAKTAGVDFKPLTEFEKRDAGDFVGSAYGNSGDNPKIAEKPERFIYYVPKSDFSTTFYELDGSGGTPFKYFENPEEFDKFGMYSLYMYGDGHIVHLNTSCKNGRKLLILKEAFANPFCCNLVNSFEDIWIADIKYMKTTATKLINENGITDLLFCLSTFSTSGENQEFLSKVM